MHNSRVPGAHGGGGAERRKQLKIVTEATRAAGKQKTNQLALERGGGRRWGERGNSGRLPVCEFKLTGPTVSLRQA